MKVLMALSTLLVMSTAWSGTVFLESSREGAGLLVSCPEYLTSGVEEFYARIQGESKLVNHRVRDDGYIVIKVVSRGSGTEEWITDYYKIQPSSGCGVGQLQ